MEKTAEHFQEAIAESKVHFQAVDPDGDGTARPTHPDPDCRGCHKKGGAWRAEGAPC